MKKLSILLTFLFVLAIPTFAQQTCKRHVETAAKFSYCPPAGWTIEEGQGEQYKVAFAPPSGSFTANINVRSSITSGSLAETADAMVKAVLEARMPGMTDMRLVSRADFKSTAGNPGVRLVYSSKFNGLAIMSVQYLFAGGPGKLVITGTTTGPEWAAHEKLFDAAMKTLQTSK